MNFLARIEQACATFIERAFARTFPSRLEPAQVARKLVSTMEAQTSEQDGRLFAPGAYVVYVNAVDFDRLAEQQNFLEREWANLLRDLAARVGAGFSGDVRVTMTARESVPLGAVEVEIAERERGTRFALRMLVGMPVDGVYPIEGRARIGRGDESEVVLLDPSVSRAHAVVEVGGRPTVRDLGSTNGTFVNGERIEARGLRDGDELRFGNTRMRFETQ